MEHPTTDRREHEHGDEGRMTTTTEPSTAQLRTRLRTPEDFARQAEERPQLPPGECERVSGYGVMGLTFSSGHVLGLRRWTASSVGEQFTSIWHRDPQGRWTFYESAPCDVACTRYFGASVERTELAPISLEWEAPERLLIRTVENPAVDWTVEVAATPITRAMSFAGSRLPLAAWRSRAILIGMGHLAGRALRVGTVKLTGLTSNAQHFDANPLRVWSVIDSTARINGVDIGAIGPLTEQAHMADFYFPQRGIFAVGRVFVEAVDRAGAQHHEPVHSSAAPLQ